MTKVTPTAVNYAEALYELKIPLTAVQTAEEIFSGNPQLQKALENPQVFKTPVVRNGRQATVGYCPDIWKGWE